MSERPAGLRFDIYERIHLAEDVPGIQELDDLELSPQIVVHDLGEQAVLKGDLLLTGKYAVIGEEASYRQLEYGIPVEITLPTNRIHRLEDVTVEIENFDVELLSARSLNVTGLLSLNGIELIPEQLYNWPADELSLQEHRAQEQPLPTAAEQEAVLGESIDWSGLFAAQSQSPVIEDAPSFSESAEANADWPRSEVQEANEPEAAYAAGDIDYGELFRSEGNAAQTNAPQQQPESNVEAVTEQPKEKEKEKPKEKEKEQPKEKAKENKEVQAEAETEAEKLEPWEKPENEAGEAEPASEGKGSVQAEEAEPIPVTTPQEMKIALGSKKQPEQSALPATDLKSLIHKSPASSAEALSEAEPKEARADQDRKNELEWRKLFLARSGEESFRKVKLCIVQKDDTIDSIAERYSLNPREILLYNRLNDFSVTAGQIIQIPK